MDYSELSKLMVKIRDNLDQIAFSLLFDFLSPKINGYYLQNGLIKDNAEELTQEVMSTIWSKSELYDATKASISTWVFAIARNKKVDFFRKNTTKSLNEEDVREFLYEENNKYSVHESEIKDQVSRINKELNKEQRKMIKMNFFENKSHKKIAEELEIPLGTVKSRIRHILTKMQRLL